MNRTWAHGRFSRGYWDNLAPEVKSYSLVLILYQQVMLTIKMSGLMIKLDENVTSLTSQISILSVVEVDNLDQHFYIG